MGTSAGFPRGLSFNYNVRQHETKVELYIDRGKGAEQENLKILEALKEHKEEVEREFGGPLSWKTLEGKRACRLQSPVLKGGYRDPEEGWAATHDAAIEKMMRLESALRPHIAALSA